MIFNRGSKKYFHFHFLVFTIFLFSQVTFKRGSKKYPGAGEVAPGWYGAMCQVGLKCDGCGHENMI